jgi:hypothetical protein
MGGVLQAVGTGIYREAARVAARILAGCGMVESVLVHRSVATGEVWFGRSDIDLLVVIGQAESEEGEKLAGLYERVGWLRRINPALNHIEVHDPGGMGSCAETDTYWGSIERRSALRLWGRPVAWPCLPVEREHAVGNFGLWVEWFFSIAVQQRSRRNLRKTVVEIWNTYATASGLIAEPYLRRSEAERHLRRVEKDLPVERLAQEPQRATGYVFELAERLHQKLLPRLGSLSRPMVFETALAPRLRRRTFVVVPRPGSPLPPEAFRERAFVCTPEVLDLFLHYTNAFLDWTLPPGLVEIGMKPPSLEEYLRSCRYYAQSRFLRHPGFLNQETTIPVAMVACLRHALEWLSRGQAPPPLAGQAVQEIAAAAPSCLEYYRTVYPRVRRENQELGQWLRGLCGGGGG